MKLSIASGSKGDTEKTCITDLQRDGRSPCKGKSIKEVLRRSPAEVIDAWGEIPEGNVHCAILAVSTLHKALADYLLKTHNG